MKNRIYILAAILLAASCRMVTYPGSIDYTDTALEPAPVLVSLGSYDPQTKSNGAIDTEEFWKWKNAQVHVYAFRADSPGFTPCTGDDDDFCLIDGAADGKGNAGRLATINGADKFLSWDSGEPLIYPRGSHPHNFYAYYIDDCAVENSDIVRTDESISMPITITGAQDIMTARTELTPERLAGMGFTPAETDILLRTAYSSHSANLGVHPELYFKHHLARISFEAFPGREEGGEVYIQEIMVESKSRAVFTAVHKDTTKLGLDFSADNSTVPMYLMDKDYKTALKRDTYQVPWTEGDENKSVYDRNSVKVGGSLMLAPAASYSCFMKIKDSADDNIEYEFEITNTSGAFEEGKHYTVRLAMYGRNEIIPDIIVTEWKDGGNYELDIR